MPTLKWLGDSDARRASRRVPYRILEPVETVGDPQADCLLIQSANLEAVRTLLLVHAAEDQQVLARPIERM